MTDIKTAQLVDSIYAKFKIRLGEKDPAFVLVELNRLVLTQAIREALNNLREHQEKLASEVQDASANKTEIATHIANQVAAILRSEFRTAVALQRKLRSSTLASAASTVAALIFSALALAYSLHAMPM